MIRRLVTRQYTQMPSKMVPNTTPTVSPTAAPTPNVEPLLLCSGVLEGSRVFVLDGPVPGVVVAEDLVGPGASRNERSLLCQFSCMGKRLRLGRLGGGASVGPIG